MRGYSCRRAVFPSQLALPQCLPDLLQSLGHGSLVASVKGVVILAFHTQVILSRHPLFLAMGIHVSLTMPQLLRTCIMPIFQVLGNGQNAAILDVAPGCIDREGGRIGFVGTSQIRHGLS